MAGLIAAYKPSKSIERIEIKIHPVDMLSWLSLQKDDVKIYGANQSDTVSYCRHWSRLLCVTGQANRQFKKDF